MAATGKQVPSWLLDPRVRCVLIPAQVARDEDMIQAELEARDAFPVGTLVTMMDPGDVRMREAFDHTVDGIQRSGMDARKLDPKSSLLLWRKERRAKWQAAVVRVFFIVGFDALAAAGVTANDAGDA